MGLSERWRDNVSVRGKIQFQFDLIWLWFHSDYQQRLNSHKNDTLNWAWRVFKSEREREKQRERLTRKQVALRTYWFLGANGMLHNFHITVILQLARLYWAKMNKALAHKRSEKKQQQQQQTWELFKQRWSALNQLVYVCITKDTVHKRIDKDSASNTHIAYITL